MGQIVGSGFSATAAMFALWIGVMGVIAVYPSCSDIGLEADDRSGLKVTVLPS